MDLEAGAAGFAAREGARVSRSFANIFFNMTMEPASVRETTGFATIIRMVATPGAQLTFLQLGLRWAGRSAGGGLRADA